MMTTKEDHSHKAIMIISMKNLTRHHKLLRCINHGRSLGFKMIRIEMMMKIMIIILKSLQSSDSD